MTLVIPVFIPHLGCLHQCLFCNQRSITGELENHRSEEEIDGTIREWLSRGRQNERVQVAFYGGSFTCLAFHEQERMLAAVRPFLKSGQVHSIRLSTRPDCIDPEICRMLSSHGVKTVELGVQSLDDRVLKLSRRGHDVRSSLAAVEILREGGMEIGIQLMVGLPGETTSSFLRGIAGVRNLRPGFVRLYPVVVVKGSGLERLYNRGEFRPLSLNRAIALSALACSRLEDAGIPVIRIGLQPSESLNESMVAGPQHPAFGELVRSRLRYREMRGRLSRLQQGESLEMVVSHRDISEVVGRRRQNIKKLEQLGFGGRFTVTADKTMQRGSIRYVVSK
jgi:histone acetyltransferase (RNA polymerase elongator complex component)